MPTTSPASTVDLTLPTAPAELTLELQRSGFSLEAEAPRPAPPGPARLVQEAQRWLHAALGSLDDGLILCDMGDAVRSLNATAEALCGTSVDEATGMPLARLLRLADAQGQPLALASLAERPLSLEGWYTGLTLTGRDGRQSAVDLQFAPLADAAGMALGRRVCLRDATPRLRDEARLAASEDRFRSLFERSPSGMALVDLDGRILQANPAMARLLGTDAPLLVGVEHAMLGAAEDREFEREQLKRLVRGKVGKGGSVRFATHYRSRGAQGAAGVRSAQVGVTLLIEAGWPSAFLYQVHDSSDDEQVMAQRIRAAFFDPLTGLGNRSRMTEQLELVLATARRERAEVAVVALNVDHFRHLNDGLGHAVGDDVLKTVGRRLVAAVRASDCVARLGADDFALVLPKAGQGTDLARLLDKIRAILSRPIVLPEHPEAQNVAITVSLGAAVFPLDGDDAPSLLRAADSALASAKRDGGNRYAFFRREWMKSAQERLALQQDLRQAVARDELRLEFQPIFDIKSGQVEAFEALMRWQRGAERVAPGEFIPIAEETGLIVQLGEWALREACRQAAAWPGEVAVSVNVSAAQFGAPGFAELVRESLESSKLTPRRLHLELTESVMLKGDAARMQCIDELRRLGVGLSVDDYGTGYSSLAYLKHYTPRALKIDKMFVDELDSDASSRAIVSATVAMAHRLGMRVVAEGVETAAQLERLRATGCDSVQGFLLGRPGAAEQVAEVIERARLAAKATLARKADEPEGWALL